MSASSHRSLVAMCLSATLPTVLMSSSCSSTGHHTQCESLSLSWQATEFYGHAIEHMRQKMKEGVQLNNIHFLETASIEIDCARFLGKTLWPYNMLASSNTQADHVRQFCKRLKDRWQIRTARLKFTAQDALDRHVIAREWLLQEMAKPFAGMNLVVTHHRPYRLSVHPRYINAEVNWAS